MYTMKSKCDIATKTIEFLRESNPYINHGETESNPYTVVWKLGIFKVTMLAKKNKKTKKHECCTYKNGWIHAVGYIEGKTKH